MKRVVKYKTRPEAVSGRAQMSAHMLIIFREETENRPLSLIFREETENRPLSLREPSPVSYRCFLYTSGW